MSPLLADPCANGVLDYEETDTDCGGSLCPSCELGEVCSHDRILLARITWFSLRHAPQRSIAG